MQLPCMIAVAARCRSESLTRSALTDIRLEESRLRHMRPGAPFEATRFACVHGSVSEANHMPVQGEQARYPRRDEIEEAMS
jgi:hypothetical protein